MSVRANAVLEIDLSSLRSNYIDMRAIVGDCTEVAAVVKSDAYGLGLAPVSQALFDVGCRLFFVADLDEALTLRSACPTASIVVFDADIAKSHDTFRAADLIAAVNDRNDLHVVTGDRTRIPYFLNIDTGFSRFGLVPEELFGLRTGGAFDGAAPRCVFSHLACSDNARDLTNEAQRDGFVAAARLFPRSRRSLSASAGVWLGPSYHFDIARIGSALFGLNNARVYPNPVRPVARLRAPLVDIRNVPRHQAIGYAATFRTRRPTCLGIVGIGYRHGLPWACANRINVRIGDFIAPVVGRIAMEYTTIDLTDVPEIIRTRGAAIDFLYDDFGIDELAAAAGVNGQEILLRVGACCPRKHIGKTLESAGVAALFGPRNVERRADLQVA